ncbi:MAG: ATP-binding cassette domain-containing protein [Ferruginibacter sp.]|nr:ATP-binding cassette domain-containing protein [Ferruginibacter sp.]
MKVLELHHLKKYFATQRAVDDMSFSIDRGDIFGLLGPNGAGKTTLIRMITGIFYPDSGDIIFKGKRFDPLNDITRIGYMPEERGLYKKMKIGDQVMYLARLKGLSKQEAAKRIKIWFERFGMESWWNKKVEDLSKGMSQKLQFVTTVMHEPDLIILDEPFSGLDPVNANLIKDEIFNLSKNGSTIIFSTHRMEQVEEICDHIVLMNTGKKILDGTISEVKQDFKEHIFNITVDTPPFSSDYFQILDHTTGNWRIKIHENIQPNQVLNEFIQRGVQVVGFNEILPSLNDIFIRLVENTATARAFQTINEQ